MTFFKPIHSVPALATNQWLLMSILTILPNLIVASGGGQYKRKIGLCDFSQPANSELHNSQQEELVSGVCDYKRQRYLICVQTVAWHTKGCMTFNSLQYLAAICAREESTCSACGMLNLFSGHPGFVSFILNVRKWIDYNHSTHVKATYLIWVIQITTPFIKRSQG